MCLGGEQSLALMTQRVHQQVAAHVNASSACFIQTMGHIKGSVEMIREFKPEWKLNTFYQSNQNIVIKRKVFGYRKLQDTLCNSSKQINKT